MAGISGEQHLLQKFVRLFQEVLSPRFIMGNGFRCPLESEMLHEFARPAFLVPALDGGGTSGNWQRALFLRRFPFGQGIRLKPGFCFWLFLPLAHQTIPKRVPPGYVYAFGSFGSRPLFWSWIASEGHPPMKLEWIPRLVIRAPHLAAGFAGVRWPVWELMAHLSRAPPRGRSGDGNASLLWNMSTAIVFAECQSCLSGCLCSATSHC